MENTILAHGQVYTHTVCAIKAVVQPAARILIAESVVIVYSDLLPLIAQQTLVSVQQLILMEEKIISQKGLVAIDTVIILDIAVQSLVV